MLSQGILTHVDRTRAAGYAGFSAVHMLSLCSGPAKQCCASVVHTVTGAYKCTQTAYAWGVWTVERVAVQKASCHVSHCLAFDAYLCPFSVHCLIMKLAERLTYT